MRERLCMCRHQISGSEGQACELRAAVEANAYWKLRSNCRSFQGTILIVFNKATKFQILKVSKRVSHSMSGDLTWARLGKPSTAQINAFSILVFNAI